MSITIPGNATTQTIYVKLNEDEKIRFSTDDQKYSAGPINWSPPSSSTTPLTITFVLKDGVTNFTTDSSNLTVKQVIAEVAVAQANDAFTIGKGDGTSEDPKIVVTPS
jgi:hypothetical protein